MPKGKGTYGTQKGRPPKKGTKKKQVQWLTRKIVLGHEHLIIFQMITTEYGKQNIFPNEPQVIVMNKEDYFENAERVNGWSAMLGFIAGLGAYVTTGQLIPGIF